MKNKLKSFFTGSDTALTQDEKEALERIIPMLLCEGMRNPEAFVTLPMCVEIWDKICPIMEEEIRNAMDEIKSKDQFTILEKMRQLRIGHIEKDLAKQPLPFNKDANTQAQKYLETSFERISNIFPQHIFLTLFPMSLQGANSGSHFIRRFLKISPFMYNQEYEKAKQILETEAALMRFYKEIVLEDPGDFNAKAFCLKWYGIEDYTIPNVDFQRKIHSLLYHPLTTPHSSKEIRGGTPSFYSASGASSISKVSPSSSSAAAEVPTIATSSVSAGMCGANAQGRRWKPL